MAAAQNGGRSRNSKFWFFYDFFFDIKKANNQKFDLIEESFF